MIDELLAAIAMLLNTLLEPLAHSDPKRKWWMKIVAVALLLASVVLVSFIIAVAFKRVF